MQFTFENIRIGRNDRAIVLGRTGCGKTTLVKYLLDDPMKPYTIVYDAKGMMKASEWKNFSLITDYQTVIESDPVETPRIIYQPPFEATLNPDEQNDFFYWIYNRYYTRVYVDEAYSLLGGINPSKGLLACLSRGRERGISTVVSSQRPARIPAITLSEAEHFYIFSLTHPADKQRVEDITAGRITSEDIEDLKPHQFLYYNAWTNQRVPYSIKLRLNNG